MATIHIPNPFSFFSRCVVFSVQKSLTTLSPLAQVYAMPPCPFGASVHNVESHRYDALAHAPTTPPFFRDRTVRYYRMAATKHHVNAACNLGACLANGVGVGKDLLEAAEWLRVAADLGDVVAM